MVRHTHRAEVMTEVMTVILITRDHAYGCACHGTFREAGLFPVCVAGIDRAVALLREFRVDLVVLHLADESVEVSAIERLYSTLVSSSPQTPVVVYRLLPIPRALAAAVREAIGRAAAGTT